MLNSTQHIDVMKASASLSGKERRCAVTNLVGDETAMLRLALDPSNTMFADLSLSGLGKGVFVCAAPDTVTEAARMAVAGDLFEGVRANLGDASSTESYADLVADRISERALKTLGLLRKAGDVIVGHTKVLKAFDESRLEVVINAEDAAANGCEKIISRARRGNVGCVRIFKSWALGPAIGRGDTMHIAVKAGAGAVRFRRDLITLHAFQRVSIDVGLKQA